MNERIDDLLSDWLDDADAKPTSDSDQTPGEASEDVAESLLIHGLLADMGSRDDDHEAERIRAVMLRIDAESESDSVTVAAPREPYGRRRFAILTSALTIAAALMVMFFVLVPQQSVSAAMASLEKVVEAAAKPFDRTYSVRVVEEYPRNKRPRNLSQEAWNRESKEQIDGATLYVRGANQYVMTVMLSSGLKRTSGCDGQQSWAFREDGPVHISTDLKRFRGGLPGQQQDIPFINIHAHLSQLQTGYDVQLSDEQEHAADGTKLSQLIGVRKSNDVRGPKQVEIWFDAETGTVHKMLLDGLPRGGGGPKSASLELVNQTDLGPDFFGHESHHPPGRPVRHEESKRNARTTDECLLDGWRVEVVRDGEGPHPIDLAIELNTPLSQSPAKEINMQHVKTLLIFAALLWISAGTVRAQNGQDPIAVAIDRDGDGLISGDELRHASTAIRGLDKNSDSIVSREEIRSSKTSTARRGESSGSRLGGYTTPPPANNVPDHPFNILVGRLTDNSVTVRVLFHSDSKAYLSYGPQSGKHSSKTEAHNLRAGVPFDFVIEALAKNTRCYYRLVYEVDGKTLQSDEYSFHTQRDSGSSFVFTVQADSHLDENTSGDVYLRTLNNALMDQPDFHFALGDTFMTGKYVKPELSGPQYLAQRYYLGHLCHSAAMYFALGNHDGESGNRGSNVWATTTRKRYFPNPFPGNFFTGNEQLEREVGLPENYYQFEWGDCQFIVLDPFRHTTTRNRGGSSGDNWYWTLGEHQYQWLKRSLDQSDAKLRFIFLHHLVGGGDRNQRGGKEAAPFWEWGGKGSSGKDEFGQHRPGWEKPIHQMLVDHGVNIVFHGHDHMFIKQDLDGIVYQLVPQPGHPRSGTKSAKEYGYLSGEVQGSSGFVRVRVDGRSARVDYVRTILPSAEGGNQRNGDVSYSYMLQGSNRRGDVR